MRKLIIVMLIFTAGCATPRTPETAGPVAPFHSAAKVEPVPAHFEEKFEQPSAQEKSFEPAPPTPAEASALAAPKDLSSSQQKLPPAPQHKQKKPFIQSRDLDLPVPDEKLQDLTDLAEENNEKVLNVFVGMYRKTVETIMGSAENPYKRRTLTGVDGQTYEVLFYLTREPRKGRPITERMLTPIIFNKGRVVAMGAYQLKKLIRTGTIGRHKFAARTSR